MSNLISSSEERLIYYKKELQNLYKNNIDIPEWFKIHLRECKNIEEVHLKKLIEYKTFENQGLNPPFCYKY